jgi:hypothetical protein
LTHERNRASLAELEEKWSIDDLFDANVALEVVTELERKMRHEDERDRR